MKLKSDLNFDNCESKNRREENASVLDTAGLGPNQKGLAKFYNGKPYWYDPTKNAYVSWPDAAGGRDWVDAGAVGISINSISYREDNIQIDVAANPNYLNKNQFIQIYVNSGGYGGYQRVLGSIRSIYNSSGNYSAIHGMTIRIVADMGRSFYFDSTRTNDPNEPGRRRIIFDTNGINPMGYTPTLYPIHSATLVYDNTIPPNDPSVPNQPNGAWIVVAAETVDRWAKWMDIGYYSTYDNPGENCLETMINLNQGSEARLPYEGKYLINVFLDVTETGRRAGSSENIDNVWALQTMDIADVNGIRMIGKSARLTGTTLTSGLTFHNDWLCGSGLFLLYEIDYPISIRVRFYSGDYAVINSGRVELIHLSTNDAQTWLS